MFTNRLGNYIRKKSATKYRDLEYTYISNDENIYAPAPSCQRGQEGRQTLIFSQRFAPEASPPTSIKFRRLCMSITILKYM